MTDPAARPSDALLSPAFLLALLVLGVNDHVLKAAFPGWVTGKLSDVAGVFAFAVFLGVALGGRRVAGAVAAGALFAAWKSPLATPAIAAWNALPLLDVARVMDATDLVALAVLVPAARMRLAPARVPARALRPAVALASVVLFAATTLRPPLLPAAVPHTWTAAQGVGEARTLLAARGDTSGGVFAAVGEWSFERDAYVGVSGREGECRYDGTVRIEARPGGGSILSIPTFRSSCGPPAPIDVERGSRLTRRLHDELLRPALGDSLRWHPNRPEGR